MFMLSAARLVAVCFSTLQRQYGTGARGARGGGISQRGWQILSDSVASERPQSSPFIARIVRLYGRLISSLFVTRSIEFVRSHLAIISASLRRSNNTKIPKLSASDSRCKMPIACCLLTGTGSDKWYLAGVLFSR